MKSIRLFLVLTLVLRTATSGAEPTLAEETAARGREREAIRKAAAEFSNELRKERVEGIPTVEQMKRLAPLMTPELCDLIERARRIQREQQRTEPDEKPDWIEGDLFSSSYEGVTGWELGEVLIGPYATARVKQTCHLEGQEPITWTDRLVFREREQRWLLDDVLMGGKWVFKSGESLRAGLPGGGKLATDHESPDRRWHLAFTREGEEVTRVTLAPVDRSAPPVVLFGEGGETCPMPCWVVWSPDGDMLALRLGDGPRFARTLIYRLAEGTWQPVEMPLFFPEEKKILAENGFGERDSLIDAEYWHDAKTLVVMYFASYSKGDEGDGYHMLVSVRIGAGGKASVVGAVDAPTRE